MSKRKKKEEVEPEVIIKPIEAYKNLDAFLESCSETPQDDTPRLIMADWLEDNMRPEWEGWPDFIRLACSELAKAHDEDTIIKLTEMLENSPVRGILQMKGGGYAIPGLVGDAWHGYFFTVDSWMRGLPHSLITFNVEENFGRCCTLLNKHKYISALRISGYLFLHEKDKIKFNISQLPISIETLDCSNMITTSLSLLLISPLFSVKKFALPKKYCEEPDILWSTEQINRLLEFFPNLHQLAVSSDYDIKTLKDSMPKHVIIRVIDKDEPVFLGI